MCPVELPHWHIEVKGTKSPLLPASKFTFQVPKPTKNKRGPKRGWVQQANSDCPEDKEWVIKNWADHHVPIAILPPCTFNKIATGNISPIAAVGDSFSPVIELEKAYQAMRIIRTFNKAMSYDFTPSTPVVVFEYDRECPVNPGGIVIVVLASVWLNWALEWEKKQ